MAMDETQQYIRKCTVLVATRSGKALDVSDLRVKFAIKLASAQTPNAANIRIFNLSAETAIKIKSEFTRVIIDAGYEGNFGIIFQGNIKQVIIGQESATDKFVDIIAGDGDLAYNFSLVKTSIAAGSSPQNQINACADTMSPMGVTTGGNSNVSSNQKLPRGKVMFGSSREYLRDVADTTNNNWSIQNEKIVFVPKTSYLPGTAVDINSGTGMIGLPQQTNEGVNVKCLINPKIKISGRIKLDNKSIVLLPVNLTLTPGSNTNTAAPLPSNGIYKVLVVEHVGDTRGTDWYSTLICFYIDSTSQFQHSVSNG